MLTKIINLILMLQARQKIAIALSRGVLSHSLRNVQQSDPKTWEFSAFSQNGEDGII